MCFVILQAVFILISILIEFWWFLWIRGPPRFEGGERRFGDRDGYRGGPRGSAGEFGGDKGGAPADYRPSFGVIILYNRAIRNMVDDST